MWRGSFRRGPFFDRDACLSSPVVASVMNGLYCRRKRGGKKKRGPGSPPRINMYAQEDLIRMLKNPEAPSRPPAPVSCITDGPASGSEWAGNGR